MGTRGSAGAGPRLGFTIWTSRVLPSGIHCTSEGPAPRATASAATAEAAAHHGVDADAFDFARLAGGVADPEFDAAVGGVGEGEVGGVGTPAAEAELGVGGQVDFDLGALGNLAQGQGAVEDGVVQSVGFGIDAHAGDAQHGLRQFGNRRIAHGLSLHRERCG